MAFTAIVAVLTCVTFRKITPVSPAIIVVLVPSLGSSPFLLALSFATGAIAEAVNLFVHGSKDCCHG